MQERRGDDVSQLSVRERPLLQQDSQPLPVRRRKQVSLCANDSCAGLSTVAVAAAVAATAATVDMDRDEKRLDECLEALITKCTDLKNSVGSFLVKLESEATGEPVNWTSALDSYAQISGQINTVMRLLKSDSLSNLRNLILLPLLMSPEPDEELAKLTEGRVLSFNHEMVPNYLRTKPEPEIESMERSFIARAGSMSQEQGPKAVTLVNKIVGQVSESVKNWKEEWESSSESGTRGGQQQTSSAVDTNSIISAITLGKGLKGPVVPDQKAQLLQQQQQQQQQQPTKGKAPVAIRTNIRPCKN